MNENKEIFEENFKLVSRTEQDVAEAIIENKKLRFQKNTTKCTVCHKQPKKLKTIKKRKRKTI